MQHHDLVGHGHGLDLVVGDIDHRVAELLVQLGDLHPHLHAQRRVEVRQRLVEQEDLRLAHDGPPDGDPLPLPARQLPRPPVQKLVDLQELRGRRRRARVDLGLRHAGMFSSPKAMFWRTVMCG